MAAAAPILVHATAVGLPVADGWHGLLLRGPPGSGKSDLALRLIDGGARLVADDQTALRREAGRIVLRAPAAIAGMLEVRGLGLVPVPTLADVPLVLVAELGAPHAGERLPVIASATVIGVAVPSLRIAPFEASAAARLRLAVQAAASGTIGSLDQAAER